MRPVQSTRAFTRQATVARVSGPWFRDADSFADTGETPVPPGSARTLARSDGLDQCRAVALIGEFPYKALGGLPIINSLLT